MTYTHDGSETASDSFTYTITDGEFGDTATVTITVEPVNDPPVANDDFATVKASDSVLIDVLANDADDQDLGFTTRSIDSFTQAANGTVALGSLSYTPNTGFVGIDSFTYKANDGTVDSNRATVSVTVGALGTNHPPVADAGPDQTVPVGQAVPLDGSGSFDSDGSITTYSWTFGDSGGANGQVVTHTYGSPGIYIVELTVTDNEGAKGMDTAVITAVEAGSTTLHVQAIDMRLVRQFGGWRTFAIASVEVRDGSGLVAEGVLVTGHWEEATSDADSGTTVADGRVDLRSDTLRKPPAGTAFVFVVDGMSKEGFVYDSGANAETRDSITVP